MTQAYGAIVLAGGSARRLAGRSKPELLLGGRRLIDRVLDAVPDAEPRVVVGPPMTLPPAVTRVREDPAGGGPVAGLVAGLAVLAPDVALVAVLAADLPFLTGEVVAELSRRIADGAVLVDESGRDQLLIGVWRVAALRRAVAALVRVDGASLRALVAPLDVARVSWEVPVDAPPPWWDCDSVEDLRRAKEWL